MRRLAGLLVVLVAVYALGVWHGRTSSSEPVKAPPQMQIPAAESDACRYFQDYPAWRETDKVVKRRGIETFCK